MIRSILLCCLAIAIVQSMPNKDIEAKGLKLTEQCLDNFEHTLKTLPARLEVFGIKSAADIVKVLKVLTPNMDPKHAAPSELLIQALEDPKVRSYVDLTLKKLPEMGSAFHGARAFLEGPEAKPLLDAIKQVLPPMETVVTELAEKLKLAFSEAQVEITKEAKIFKTLLQKPEVKEVLVKFEALPEVTQLHEIGKSYGLDLLGNLNKGKQLISQD
ncbi:unnamed protein product [Allacma fusca]|uniref:Uncharacterized protein n=1 Tax=Allacma fusca TaxID=39272 RepID=A0A8J2LVH8_9HEXA|nr:unnamed protein product [Allacma fusca]